MVSDSDLVNRLRDVLRSSDLDMATPASVRRQLEADFGVDLTDRKAFIREQIDAFLESDAGGEAEPEAEDDGDAYVKSEVDENDIVEAEEEGDNEECDEEGSEGDENKKERPGKVKKRRGGFNKLCQISPKLENIVGASKMGRTEVVKKIWAYIREKGLQDPKNRKNIICDESFHTLFGVKTIDMFKMNKALSKHIWPLSDRDEDAIDANEKTQVEENDASEAEEVGDNEEYDNERSEGDEGKRERPAKVKKRRGGFNKLCQISPKLEKIVGASKLGRTEVVKKIWAYIREKSLQDPKNKRNIICDELFHALFGVKTIDMFKMNKALSKHIWPLSDGDGCINNLKEENEDEASGETGGNEEQNEEVEENNEDESEEEEERRERTSKRTESSKANEKTKKKGGGFSKVCSLSPELQAFTGVPQLARTEVVKLLWSYIKENNLQDPSDKRKIICDGSLRPLFRVDSINMFQMNKQLSKHIWPLEEDEGGPDNSPRKGKRKQEIEEDSDEPKEKDKRQKKGGSSGLLAPLPLSDALVKFLGTGENSLSRGDVVKRIWEYIKQNDLQDPSDRRRILCDEKLKELFEVDSFQGFSVSKLLTNHFIKD